MQVPPIIPKVTAPGPNELKPEPVQRVAPVVIGDAANRIDPSVILKTPVPVSSGPQNPNLARSPTDQRGPLHVSPDGSEDAQAAQHIAKLVAQIGKAEAGPNTVKWPAFQAAGQQMQLPVQTGALAAAPRAAMAALMRGLEQSPIFGISLLAESLGLVKDKSSRPTAQSNNVSAASNASGGANNAAATGAANTNPGAAQLPLFTENQLQFSAALKQAAALDTQQAQQAVSLMMHGQLVWQGELTPGVMATIYREDAYMEDPSNPTGPLLKGAQLSVEAVLPSMGRLVLRGMQIADSVSVVVNSEAQAHAILADSLPDLKRQLKKADLEFVNVRLQEPT